VRKLFTSLSVDDIGKTVSFTMRNPVDDNSDIDFVVEIFGLGVVWKWVEPKYKSVLNTSQFFGGKEQRWFSQAQHLSELRMMNDNARIDLYKYIASHGYYNNSYIKKEGE